MAALASNRPSNDARSRSRRILVGRVALLLVAIPLTVIAIWGLVSPHSFFRNFPGGGHHWVSVLGSYNQHLIRDYAAAELGFAVLLIAGAIWFRRTLVLAAGVAFLAASVPHFAYHLTTTDRLSTTDNLASLGSFLLEFALIAVAMAIAGWDLSPEHGGRAVEPASTPR